MKKVLLLATWVLASAALVAGCESSAKKSAAEARAHVAALAKLGREDARELREGLPRGGAELEKIFASQPLNAETAREAIGRARDKVQDLRTAKSTFFALAAPDGIVIRNDQDQDRMAHQGLFASFPSLKGALDKPYVEARGSMPEAAEIRGRPDAQWVAAVPVKVAGATQALFVSGWSWSAYAYRLQMSLRSSALAALKENEKLPLLYAVVVVDAGAYGSRDLPDVNIDTVLKQKVLEKARGGQPFGEELEITGRAFGLGAILVPELGEKVAFVVLRSET